MRILLISPGFPDREGIYRPGIVDTLVALIARGHRIEVHTTREPPSRPHSTYRGLSIHAHGRAGGVRAHAKLLRAIRGRDFDLVWSIWPNKTGIAAMAARRLVDRPLVVSLAGGELVHLPELRYGEPNQRRVRRILNDATVVTAGSEIFAARARAWGARADVAPLGVEFGEVAIRPARASRRIVVISDPSPIKRTSWALDAARDLAREIDGEVTAFGDIHSHGIDCRGFVAPAVLRRMLADFDVSIHASAHESQGIAMIEAAYAGLAVATFDVGVAKTLRDLGARLVVADRISPVALTEAARSAIDLEGTNPGAIADRFSAEACAKRFEQVFERSARAVFQQRP